MSDSEDPEVPLICPECDTRTRVPLDEIAAARDRHNDQIHDGDPVATVDPELADALADLVAEDMDLL